MVFMQYLLLQSMPLASAGLSCTWHSFIRRLPCLAAQLNAFYNYCIVRVFTNFLLHTKHRWLNFRSIPPKTLLVACTTMESLTVHALVGSLVHFLQTRWSDAIASIWWASSDSITSTHDTTPHNDILPLVVWSLTFRFGGSLVHFLQTRWLIAHARRWRVSYETLVVP